MREAAKRSRGIKCELRGLVIGRAAAPSLRQNWPASRHDAARGWRLAVPATDVPCPSSVAARHHISATRQSAAKPLIVSGPNRGCPSVGVPLRGDVRSSTR